MNTQHIKENQQQQQQNRKRLISCYLEDLFIPIHHISASPKITNHWLAVRPNVQPNRNDRYHCFVYSVLLLDVSHCCYVGCFLFLFFFGFIFSFTFSVIVRCMIILKFSFWAENKMN